MKRNKGKKDNKVNPPVKAVETVKPESFQWLNNPYFKYILGGLLFLIIIVVYAEWVGDNDLWWHMKYGEYMLEHKTLRPDHTVFSWTPADKDWIYVTWLPDIAFHLMYSFGGLPLLYIFRYVTVLLIAAIVMFYGLKQKGHDVFMLLLTTLIVVAQLYGVAQNIKPELTSLVFFSIAVFIYLYGRENNGKAFFLYPLLFIVWVNSHGVFIFGYLLLGLLLLGEVLSYALKLKNALALKELKLFVSAVILSFAVMFFNPYGISYPLYTVEMLTSPDFQEYAKDISAMQSPLDTIEKIKSLKGGMQINWNVVLTSAMAVIFVVLAGGVAFKKGVLNLPLLFANIAFFVLFFKALRTGIFYPIIWGFSIACLYPYLNISQLKKKIISLCCIALFLFESGYLLYSKHSNRIWLGMEAREVYAPEREIDFLKRHDLLKYPMFNEYLIGGYLLWALYPEHKVFLDPRGSVYVKTGVYQDYAEMFLRQSQQLVGENVKMYSIDEVVAKKPLFEKIQSKYPFKIAVIQMGMDTVIFPFLFSEDWRMIYFDVNAVIFAHKSLDVSDIKADLGPQRFGNIKNINQYVIIFTFYLNLRDINSAIYIFETMRSKFPGHYMINYCERMLRIATGRQ